jgi:glycosyltransferase involved in cell wall biosynthesis
MVYKALEKADVFVLLSEIDIDGFRDGFPTVILEAMAMSLPVVSTWVSGIPEMIEPGITGVLVPERDVKAAADAIAGLLDQEGLRHAMGSAGRKKLESQFNATDSADLRALVLRKIAKS